MKEITIPDASWAYALAKAIAAADSETIILVGSADKAEIARLAAERLGKTITVEIRQATHER